MARQKSAHKCSNLRLRGNVLVDCFSGWLVKMATYVMPQMPVVAQPVITQSTVIVAAPTAELKGGPNMGYKQNTTVWASDECGCCNDCCVCE